jgi:hypothetical protein
MKPLMILTLATVGLTGCFRPAPPIKAVPCIALTPRTDAARVALRAHPETPKAVGETTAAIILGTEAVCK